MEYLNNLLNLGVLTC